MKLHEASILVVDDDPLAIDLLMRHLRSAGCRPVVACDGDSAWLLLRDSANHFDLVISDRSMPGLNGMQLLQRIKSDPRLAATPVIFETASTEPSDMAESIAAGVYYYLAKPFDERLLLTIVETALNEHDEEQKLRAAVRSQIKAMRLLQHGHFVCRTPDEARDLASLLAAATPTPEPLVLGLSELLLNGIEHGNLGIGYAEKCRLMLEGRLQDEIAHRLALPGAYRKLVTVEVTRDDGQLTFRITDQGFGFDPDPYFDLDPARAVDPNGRGIAMARIMSFDQLDYEGRGNIAVARISV